MRRYLLMGVMVMACSETKVVEGFPDEFVGVGVEISTQSGSPTIVRTISGGAADEAGLQKGDRLHSIDGVDVSEASLGDIVMRLRGKPGTQVTIGITRSAGNMIVILKRRAMIKKDSNYKQANKANE